MKKENRPVIGILGVPTHDDEGDSLIAIYNGVKNALVKKDVFRL